jgi:hypothetical protein
MTVPFPKWAWHTAPEILPEKATLEALSGQLNGLHGLFAAGKLGEVIARCQEKNKERALANYFSEADVADLQRESYESMMNEPGYTLQPLVKDKLRLNIYGDGRLANVTSQLGESPLYYGNAEGNFIAQVLFMFRQDKSGKWVICR